MCKISGFATNQFSKVRKANTKLSNMMPKKGPHNYGQMTSVIIINLLVVEQNNGAIMGTDRNESDKR